MGGVPVPFPLNVLGELTLEQRMENLETLLQGVLPGIKLASLAAPAAPTVTPTGSGATTYTYVIVPRLGTLFAGPSSPSGSTSSQNATLSASAYNTVSWTGLLAATAYDIYRTAGGATQGKIGSIPAAAGQTASTAYSITDTGLFADGTTAPVVGTAGSVTLATLFYESYADNITAHAGGGQASAVLLTSELNRIATVATAGDSVLLPPSAPGLTVVTINHGAKAMQVYGSGSDTIDDVAAATGVSQMPGSVCIYMCTTAGNWYTEGLGTGYSGSLQTLSFADALTAHAGGGQASALQLAASVNRITTVATAADSVKLPASAPGLAIVIVNAGANPMQVFGAGTDTINGVATATGVSQMPGSVVEYVCTVAGIWLAQGLGAGYSGSLATQSAVTGITAHAGGGQGSATALPAMLNRVTTVATAGDSVVMPASVAGLAITVVNSAINSCNVFPASGDNINSLGANAAFALAGGQTATFECPVAGFWFATFTPMHAQTEFAYTTNAATSSATLTAANVTGGSVEVHLNLTGALGAAANATLPTVASLVAAIPNAAAGQTYKLRLINSSSGAYAWTVLTNTGWTLNGTMTVQQNTWRDFIVTLTSMAAATLQSTSTGTYS